MIFPVFYVAAEVCNHLRSIWPNGSCLLAIVTFFSVDMDCVHVVHRFCVRARVRAVWCISLASCSRFSSLFTCLLCAVSQFGKDIVAVDVACFLCMYVLLCFAMCRMLSCSVGVLLSSAVSKVLQSRETHHGEPHFLTSRLFQVALLTNLEHSHRRCRRIPWLSSSM